MVAFGLIALIIPLVYQGMHIAAQAGEVSQRKAIAARIADRVLNEAIISSTTATATSGKEAAGPYQFTWTTKDDAWGPLTGLPTLSTPVGVNQASVNSTIIHELSVDVTYSRDGPKITACIWPP